MSIYKVSIPIANYFNDEIFFKEIYFQGTNCPTYEKLLDFLTRMNHWQHEQAEFNRDSQCNRFEYEDCLNSLKTMKDEFPYLTKNMFSSNTFVTHPKYGLQPLTVSRIYCEPC